VSWALGFTDAERAWVLVAVSLLGAAAVRRPLGDGVAGEFRDAADYLSVIIPTLGSREIRPERAVCAISAHPRGRTLMILPPKCPRGTSPPIRMAAHRAPCGCGFVSTPPSGRAADLFLTVEYPHRRSPDRYRKTRLTWEPSIGAPLRNRTVDLLLTIDNQHVPGTAAEPLNWPDAGSHELSQALASAH
jgi:hypothetical protein